MGSWRRRGKKGFIEIRWYDRNGLQQIENLGTADADEAERKINEYEGAALRDEAAPKGTFTIDAAVDLVKADYKANDRKTSAHVDRRWTKHLEPWFAGRRMARTGYDELMAYVDQRKDAGASNAEINRELAIVRRGFTLARRAKKITVIPPFPDLDEKKNRRKGFFEREHFEAIRRKLPADYRGLATLYYWTGWRKLEGLALEWHEVDRDRQVITLDEARLKEGDERVFVYGAFAELVDAIEEAWRVHKRFAKQGTVRARVWIRTVGVAGANPGDAILDFRKAWQTACEAAGRPGAMVHAFRRTAVRNLENAGVARTRAKAMVGHKTDEIYERYGIVNDADRQAAADQLAAFVDAETAARKGNKGKSKGKSGKRVVAAGGLRIVRKAQGVAS